MWKYAGQIRPPFAIEPKPGQESVWDYPRPPRLERCQSVVEVYASDERLARTSAAYRVLETASPPTFYLPPHDIDLSLFNIATDTSYCEWKGQAQYWSLNIADNDEQAVAWSYPVIAASFKAIENYLCFYPSRVACFVEGERVRSQKGDFYGGWVTNHIVGPWKGGPGTAGW